MSTPRRLASTDASRKALGTVDITAASVISRKGLQLTERLPFEKWSAIGAQLANHATSVAWCLGDWLVYGEKVYSDRYRDAIKQTSMDYQTLRNYAWVARRFSLSRRRDRLSFGHHAEVAGLPAPEQDFWLRKAEEKTWSRNRLRREVRASLRERKNIETTKEPGILQAPDESAPDTADGQIQYSAFNLNVHISPEQMTICKSAADSQGMKLEEWILRALEEAARNTFIQG